MNLKTMFALLPEIANCAAPGPLMLRLRLTMSRPLFSVIVPVTEKLIVSPDAALAIASRNRQFDAEGQFAAFAAPSARLVTVLSPPMPPWFQKQ
jgi:hypothetical protein